VSLAGGTEKQMFLWKKTIDSHYYFLFSCYTFLRIAPVPWNSATLQKAKTLRGTKVFRPEKSDKKEDVANQRV
jgi:hypothetical protein